MLMLIFAVVIGIIGGYVLCWYATWNRVYRQESSIRSLATDVAVMKDMGDPVTHDWVQDRLDQILVKEFR